MTDSHPDMHQPPVERVQTIISLFKTPVETSSIVDAKLVYEFSESLISIGTPAKFNIFIFLTSPTTI